MGFEGSGANFRPYPAGQLQFRHNRYVTVFHKSADQVVQRRTKATTSKRKLFGTLLSPGGTQTTIATKTCGNRFSQEWSTSTILS